jgi:predicted RNase H-like HicB family nuclease
MKTYTVVVEQDPEGKWTLTAPALPGYVACGDTQEEVLALAREGIPFHLECLKEEGLPLPEGKGDAKVLLLEIAA